jgi:hypothetical protein
MGPHCGWLNQAVRSLQERKRTKRIIESTTNRLKIFLKFGEGLEGFTRDI